MISPRAFRLLIRHLDSIDEAISLRFKRKRPHQEPGLTSLLCDLLDDDTCGDEKLSYSRAELQNDVRAGDEAVQMSIRVETHEYTANIERWVTQADLGLVINFLDFIEPEYSHSTSWLLQAKRLEPQLHSKVMYSENSRFGGKDNKQHQRIIELAKVVGLDFIRYLLYCPRPSLLDEAARAVLARQRVLATSSHIFDYMPGLELHSSLLSGASSLAAGIFVAPINNTPLTLKDVHRRISGDTQPFSWFVAQHFSSIHHLGAHTDPRRVDRAFPSTIRISPYQAIEFDPTVPATIAHGVVAGDSEAVECVLAQLEVDEEFQFLPPHTLVLDVSMGREINFETRTLQ